MATANAPTEGDTTSPRVRAPPPMFSSESPFAPLPTDTTSVFTASDATVYTPRTEAVDPLSAPLAPTSILQPAPAIPPKSKSRQRRVSQFVTFNDPFNAGDKIEVPKAGDRRVSIAVPEDRGFRDAARRKLNNLRHGRPLNAPAGSDKRRKSVVQALVQRSNFAQVAFTYGYYFLILAVVYFVLIGVPLWNGTAWYIWDLTVHHSNIPYGFLIFMSIAAFYAITPLLSPFDPDPPSRTTEEQYGLSRDCALLIPAYKAAKIIPATIESALKVFPPQNIFVIANGNSPTPLDDSEDVCLKYGVNHVWSPIGSKIVAQLVGCAVIPQKYILAIDDDCHIPPNLPIRTDLLEGTKAGSVAYLLKSVGPNGSKGNIIQQLQDLEYKLAGAVKNVGGRLGSCTFGHGAMVLWDKQAYEDTFAVHPGFRISEDWFFGHATRELGRPIMCTSEVFTETETPPYLFFQPKSADRGGFGEMTVFKQRFYRWNFFFVSTLWYNVVYILFSWKMSLRAELACKPFVFQEAYETVLYLTLPFFTFSSLWASWSNTLIYSGAVIGIYFLVAVIFNYWHLRRKGAMVGWQCIAVFLPYKFTLVLVNTVSVYWTIWEYARFFAKKHFRVTDDPAVIEVCTEARDPKTGQVTSMRKVSIAVGASFANAPVPGERHGSINTRASAAAIDIGGARKYTAIHRPSNAQDIFAAMGSIDAGGRRPSAIPVPSGSSPSGTSPSGAADVQIDASLQVPFIRVESRRLSLGAAPLNSFGGVRRGSLMQVMEAPDEEEEDAENLRQLDEEAAVGGSQLPARTGRKARPLSGVQTAGSGRAAPSAAPVLAGVTEEEEEEEEENHGKMSRRPS